VNNGHLIETGGRQRQIEGGGDILRFHGRTELAARSQPCPHREGSGRQNARTDISPRRPYNDGASLRSVIRDAGRVLVRVLAARSRSVIPPWAGAGGRTRAQTSRLVWGTFLLPKREKTVGMSLPFHIEASISADQRRQLGGRLLRLCAAASGYTASLISIRVGGRSFSPRKRYHANNGSAASEPSRTQASAASRA